MEVYELVLAVGSEKRKCICEVGSRRLGGWDLLGLPKMLNGPGKKSIQQKSFDNCHDVAKYISIIFFLL